MAYKAGFQALEQRDSDDNIVVEGVVSKQSPFASFDNAGIYDIIAEDLRYLNEKLEGFSTSGDLAKIRDEVQSMYNAMITDANFGNAEAKAQAEIATNQANIAKEKVKEITDSISQILDSKAAAEDSMAELKDTIESTKKYISKISDLQATVKGYANVATNKATEATTQATNATNAKDKAMAWADGSTSPDGEQDTDSSTGLTMSAKGWALRAKEERAEAEKAEANAKASENNVKTSANNVKTSEVNTKTSESNAKASEDNAKASAVNAKTSEVNAKTAEINAKASENAAKESESNAKASENNIVNLLSDLQSNVDKTDANVRIANTWAEGKPDNEVVISDAGNEVIIEHFSAKGWAEKAETQAEFAKTYLSTVQANADNAQKSEDNAKVSEDNAKASEDNAKISEDNAKTSENNVSDMLDEVTSNVAIAKSCSETAKIWSEGNPESEEVISDDGSLVTIEHLSSKEWANRAKENYTQVKEQIDISKGYLDDVKASKESIEVSEANAGAYSAAAKNSESNASISEGNAKVSESNAKVSEDNAKISEVNAKASEDNARASEDNAKVSENNAKSFEGATKELLEKAKKWAESDEVIETTTENNTDENGEPVETQVDHYSAKYYAFEAEKVYSDAIEFESRIKAYTDDAKDVFNNMVDYEATVKGYADNAKETEGTTKQFLNEVIAKTESARTSEENAKGYVTLAQAWADSAESPDDDFDEDGFNGKTQSAKTWALQARENSLEVKKDKADIETCADNANNLLSQVLTIQSSVETTQETIGSLVDQANSVLEETKTIRDSVSNTIEYKGKVENYSDLPTEDNRIGDMYYVQNADEEHNINSGDSLVWNGTTWDDIGGGMDTDKILNNGNDAKFGIVEATTFKGDLVGNAATADVATIANKAQSVDWANVANRPTSLPANGGTADKATSAEVCTGNAATASSVDWSGVKNRPTSLPANGGTADVAKSVDWSGITGKPATFSPSAHNHDTSYPSVTGARASGTWGISISGKAATAGTADTAKSADAVAWANVSGKPSTFAPSAHNHDASYPSVTGARASGTWGISISGKAATAGTADTAKSAGAVAWANVSGKPSSMAANGGNSDTVGGYKENVFLRNRGTTQKTGEESLWAQIGIKQYSNALPDGISAGATYAYGAVVSLPATNSRLDLWYNHQASANNDGIWYRTGWDKEKKGWRYLLDNANYTKCTVTKTGGGASGTWGISISGKATTAGTADTAKACSGNAATATSAGYSKLVEGTYSGKGGQQPPSYCGKKRIKFLMANTSINGHTGYKNWMYLDCYDGADAGGASAIGVARDSCRAFIMNNNNADRKAWTGTAELLSTANYNSYAPKKDGTGASGTWKINITGNAATASNASKVGGFTVGCNVPANAKFTDTNTTYGVATTAANGLMSAADKKKLDSHSSLLKVSKWDAATATLTLVSV